VALSVVASLLLGRWYGPDEALAKAWGLFKRKERFAEEVAQDAVTRTELQWQRKFQQCKRVAEGAHDCGQGQPRRGVLSCQLGCVSQYFSNVLVDDAIGVLAGVIADMTIPGSIVPSAGALRRRRSPGASGCVYTPGAACPPAGAAGGCQGVRCQGVGANLRGGRCPLQGTYARLPCVPPPSPGRALCRFVPWCASAGGPLGTPGGVLLRAPMQKVLLNFLSAVRNVLRYQAEIVQNPAIARCVTREPYL
jgi:hypothetical protein